MWHQRPPSKEKRPGAQGKGQEKGQQHGARSQTAQGTAWASGWHSAEPRHGFPALLGSLLHQQQRPLVFHSLWKGHRSLAPGEAKPGS